MVVTYWEMAASFITAGVLHQELFLQSGQELLFVWEKIRDIVPDGAVTYGNPKIMANVETVSKAAIEFMNRGNAKPTKRFQPGCAESASAVVARTLVCRIGNRAKRLACGGTPWPNSNHDGR